MTKNIITTLLCVILFCNCTGDKPECEACDTSKPVDVTFSLMSNTTISRSIGTPPSNSESDVVTNFQIFVFNTNGDLERTEFYPNTDIHTAVIFKVIPGVKDFYAITNLDAPITSISKKQDLANMIADIKDKKHTLVPFLMVAQIFNKQIYPEGDVHEKNDIVLSVERLVARVQLKYKVNFTNTNYEKKEFIVDSIYILRGNTQCTYSTINKDAQIIASEPYNGSATYPNFFSDFVEAGNWPSKGNSTTVYYPGAYTADEFDCFYFYIFPNQDAAAPTSIIISARLDGTRTYYPIIINKTGICEGEHGGRPSHELVMRNTIYDIKATITGRGSDEPEVPVEYVDMSVNVDIKNWSNVSQDSEFN